MEGKTGVRKQEQDTRLKETRNRDLNPQIWGLIPQPLSTRAESTAEIITEGKERIRDGDSGGIEERENR